MAEPTRYERLFSFAGFQATQPNKPLPGNALDGELENVERSVNEAITAINDIRREDGALRNGIVTADALAPGLATGVSPATEWLSGVQYQAQNTVFFGSAFYRCVTGHVSGVFSADFAAGRWVRYADLGPIVDEAAAARDTAVISAATATAAASTATGASTAATTAANTATTLYDLFDDRYLGEKTSLPTLDNDGGTIVDGALVSLTGQANPALNGMYVRRGGAWHLVIAPVQGVFLGYRYVATAGQTTFTGVDANGVTLAYTPGAILVTLNGAALAPTAYTATTGSSIVLGTAASAGDTLVVYSFGSFAVADTWTRNQADARYAWQAGSRAALAAHDVPAGVQYVQTAGYNAVGDGGGALYRRVVSEPAHAAKVQSAGGVWWEAVFVDHIPAAALGAFGTGFDETAALNAALSCARVFKLPVRLAGRLYKTSAVLDVSAITLIGDAMGYRNANATIIEGSGGHDILSQVNATAADTHVGLHNLRLRGGVWGVKVRYLLNSHFSNVAITDCTNGFQFGNSSDAGGLFNVFDNIDTDVTGTGLDLNGNQFVNANTFNHCFFKGAQFGGDLRCNGGIGATANVFNATEFLGDRYGVRITNTSNTVFQACYFESKGPSLLISGTRNVAWALNNCVFSVLENTNPTGRNAFVYHEGVGSTLGSVDGGYIYQPAGAVYNNLSFIASESPANFRLSMLNPPVQEVAASGFVLLNGLLDGLLSLGQSGSYTPTWTGSGSPAIGNGTLTGIWSRSGNIVTVTIQFTAGSTTNFGGSDWVFSLPFAAQSRAAGTMYINDSGVAFFHAVGVVESGASLVSFVIPGGATRVGSAVPFTWGTADNFVATITYRC